MPATSNTFSSGNYNSWNKLVKETFPKINSTIRENIIPTLDSTLTKMLGYNSDWEKDSINITQIFEDNQITGVNCTLTYIVEDFKVQAATEEAIQEDCNTISNSLQNDVFNIKQININTSTGELSILFEILFEDTEDGNTR